MTEELRVLVMDDDPMQLELVERALSRDGFSVCTVSTIAELVAESQRFGPQIVLIDVNMPESPPERTVAVARDTAHDARVVLYSAWEESKLRGLSIKTGADGFISKSESVMAIGRRLRDFA